MLKSISAKLITLFIALSVLVALISGIIFISIYSNHEYEELEDTLITCANNISEVISEKGGYSKNVLLQDIDFTVYLGGNQNFAIWIANSSGLFLSKANTYSPKFLKELSNEEIDNINTALKGNKVITSSFSTTFSEPMISVVVPIYENEKYMDFSENPNLEPEIIGTLILHSPTSDISASIRTAQFFSVLAILGAFILSAVVGIIFSRMFTKPINTLRLAAAKLSRGDYDTRVQLKNQSELSDLAHSLNHLAANMKSTFGKMSNETSKLNNIIDNVSDGLAAYDTNMHLIKYNSALLKLCDEDYFQKAELKEAIAAVMNDGEKRTVILEDDAILKFTITQNKSDETVDGVVIIVSDISQSERLERLRREFVANVSHEFRTPLTVIRGSVEVLLDGAVTEEEDRQSYYQKIETETVALERLVGDLLDTTRLREGKIKIDLQKTDVVPLLENLAETMNDIAENKDIRVIYEKSALPPLMCDKDRIRQLIIIFIDNAIKFTPKGGLVTISTAIKENMGCIHIKDTGMGISEDDIPYLFERFYKADKARGGSETGTGLGLAIASQIVELHGGRILVDSQLGKGTTFKIQIPLAPDEE